MRSKFIPPRYPWHTRQDEAARMRFILEGRCPKCGEVHPLELGKEVHLVRKLGIPYRESNDHPVDRIAWPASE